MRWIVTLALGVIRRSDLTMAERTAALSTVLGVLEALPLKAVIESTDKGITLRGKVLEAEQVRSLQESATVALNNQAFNLIGEQVVWIAIQRGIHNADTPEKLYFYRAAIWFSEQMKAHLQVLAQRTPEMELADN